MKLNLRYKIIFLVLIIFCGVISSSYAQNVNEFKNKSTNVTDGKIDQNLSDVLEENQSYSRKKIKSYSRSSSSSKIRFRFLKGSYSSDQKDATNTTSKIIWDKFGIGKSVFKTEGNRSGNKYKVENKFLDLSYTFGIEYTFTLGGRSITGGEMTITDTESIEFISTKVYGSGYFSNFGIEFGFFEILFGYEYFRYVYVDFDTESSSGYWGNFEDWGGQYTLGLGLVF